MLFLNLFGTTLCINFYIENFLNELFYFFFNTFLPKIHHNVFTFESVYSIYTDVCTVLPFLWPITLGDNDYM